MRGPPPALNLSAAATMNSNWNHGYSFCGGAIAGLALSYRPWLIFAAGFLTALAVMGLFKFGRSLGGLLTARMGTGRFAARPVPFPESRGATRHHERRA